MKYTGYVEYFSVRKEDTGFVIFNLVSDDFEDGEMKCIGVIPGLEVGDNIEVEGREEVHAIYGAQIRVTSYKNLPKEDIFSIERYLASGAIKGVGAALAARIVKKFKTDTIRIMEEEPERLSEIKGISERMAREIGIQVVEKRELRDAMMYLAQYGISNSMALKIYRHFGADLYQIMRENPYRLADEIRGIGFRSADEIAERCGITKDSPARINCGILYVLSQYAAEGHTYMPKEEFITAVRKVLEVSEEQIIRQTEVLSFEKKIIEKEGLGIFLPSLYYAEGYIANRLGELRDAFLKQSVSPSKKDEIINRIETIKKEDRLNLDDVQTDAVFQAVSRGLFLLTGGPGTGKTTTIRAIIRYFDNLGETVLLCAPTGRAAKRMEEATGYEAKTIHRLLEVSGAPNDDDTAIFNRNELNPLEADVIIVDEMSMVDTLLFKSLLSAVPTGCRLILSGDANQLPSVGPGNILKDLLNQPVLERTMLEKIYRQEEGGDIAANADFIRRGLLPVVSNESSDFFFVQRNETASVYRDIVLLMKEKIPAKFKINEKQVQVLTPMRNGTLGVSGLNPVLQEKCNPKDPKKGEMLRGETVFRLGDRVMQIKNNYNIKWRIRGINNIVGEEGEGVFNGDTGIITDVNPIDKSITVTFDDNKEVEYERDMLEELELAYAITIHKSQGSEYPAVILPLLDGPAKLYTRNLLYTAVSRGSKCVMILGKWDAVKKMVETEGNLKRYTGLPDRLKEIFEDEE